MCPDAKAHVRGRAVESSQLTILHLHIAAGSRISGNTPERPAENPQRNLTRAAATSMGEMGAAELMSDDAAAPPAAWHASTGEQVLGALSNSVVAMTGAASTTLRL